MLVFGSIAPQTPSYAVEDDTTLQSPLTGDTSGSSRRGVQCNGQRLGFSVTPKNWLKFEEARRETRRPSDLDGNTSLGWVVGGERYGD